MSVLKLIKLERIIIDKPEANSQSQFKSNSNPKKGKGNLASGLSLKYFTQTDSRLSLVANSHLKDKTLYVEKVSRFELLFYMD